jgi:hypothetical protein
MFVSLSSQAFNIYYFSSTRNITIFTARAVYNVKSQRSLKKYINICIHLRCDDVTFYLNDLTDD